MKFKAAVTDNAPQRLVERLDAPETAAVLMRRVVVGCLRVDEAEIGPATHYVQHTDRLVSVSDHVGVVVGLTMVSKNRSRSDQDFADALDTIEAVYEDIIASEVPRGARAQLFVAIALDGEIEAPSHMAKAHTNLIETEAKWIDGNSDGLAVAG